MSNLYSAPLARGALRLHSQGLGYAERQVLGALQLEIQPGERVALLGRSGAGKTTLLRQLRLQHAEQVAWCPQQPGLVPMLSVFHNIYMGRLDQHSSLYNLLNLLRPQAKPLTAISQLSHELGLADYLHHSCDRLSGGQQSRVNLGRALYQQRPIFVGDEPVSAVDELQADALLSLLCRRHQTLVVALHDVEMALRHCTRILGLRDGQIELDAPANQLSTAELLRLYVD